MLKQKFEQLDNDTSYQTHEKPVQEYWDTIKIYDLMRDKGNGKEKFNFVDGPPFVSGSLHYGHIAVGAYKSSVCNTMSMYGYDASYTLGFDCHGLPIESKVCKEHDLSS